MMKGEIIRELPANPDDAQLAEWWNEATVADVLRELIKESSLEDVKYMLEEIETEIEDD
jgi:hypothetical protein